MYMHNLQKMMNHTSFFPFSDHIVGFEGCRVVDAAHSIVLRANMLTSQTALNRLTLGRGG